MPSVDNKELIDEIIKNDGYYYDDPRVLKIHSYTNEWGGVTYHLAYTPEQIDSLLTSPYCHNIKQLWQRK